MNKKTNKKETQSGKESAGKLKVISLGGLAEIGKNMTVLEYKNDIIIIDCGMGFPDDDMLGIDLVIPDISYLVKNADKIRGILITHGHEDHIGAIAYILSQINVPVYATRLSLGIIEGKIKENSPGYYPELYTVEAGDTVNLGVFKAEFIHVNHSIADATAIAIKTPVGTVFHTGDFKLDVSPIDGRMMDITRIGEIGREGVSLLLCESTNAERQGYTPSERTVGSSLERIFTQYEKKRIIIATFSSNVHRVQQIINASAAHGRKVAVLGRSMENIIGAARELGYMDMPEGVLINSAEIKRYRPQDLTLITTGSQGEPMSALYRIAFAEHDRVKLSPDDVVILSSSAIPGNEKFVGKIINALVRSGVKVVNDSVEDVHVSGHACREEIKLMIALLKPKYYMPIHGEYRHLYSNKEIGEFMGIPSQNIFISEIGRVLEVDKSGARFNGTVPAGNILIDGSGVGDIGSVVLRDRKHLAEDGLVVIVAAVDTRDKYLVSGPDIISRGFVYVKESEELVDGAREVAESVINSKITKKNCDFAQLKNSLREEVGKYIYKETKRKPMILAVIMEV
ncbi:MAG: ribonuclease J [Clostridia bacterium]|nr:ribonuclease J [Clostridia bacterium]